MPINDMYEIHLTLPLPTPMERTALEALAREFHWKTSEIERDPVLGQAAYFYLTTHTGGLFDAVSRMGGMVDVLKERNFTVLREKIEMIVHDTKTGIEWNKHFDDEPAAPKHGITLTHCPIDTNAPVQGWSGRE